MTTLQHPSMGCHPGPVQVKKKCVLSVAPPLQRKPHIRIHWNCVCWIIPLDTCYIPYMNDIGEFKWFLWVKMACVLSVGPSVLSVGPLVMLQVLHHRLHIVWPTNYSTAVGWFWNAMRAIERVFCWPWSGGQPEHNQVYTLCCTWCQKMKCARIWF